MIRWPGSIVVSWMVNGLRTVRANHWAGAQYRIISSRATGHVGVEIGTHRGHLVGPAAQLPQPVRDDLRHGLGAADEDAEHLGGGLDVGERRAVGQPVVDQTVDDRQFTVGARRRACARTIGIRYSR